MENQIIEIISNITKLDVNYLKDNSTEEKLWGSLKNVEIILEVEDTFNITFTEEELKNLTSLNNYLKIVKEKVE